MKTKISHLGRSSVSVILAVMMLLSTMLIGTVSTVNAVTKKFNSVNLVGNINGNTKWDSTEYPFTFDETTGVWYLDITFTKRSVFKARVNNGWDISFGDSNRNDCVISDNEIGDYTISIKDDSPDKTPLKVEKKTVKKVADSVTLTASHNSVQVGTEVTLTASLNNKATDLDASAVTYEFERTNGAKVTGIPNGNTYKFTPATAGDYIFKVTASAKNYTSVTNTVKVTATSDSSAETTQPVTGEYYFWYSTNADIEQYSGNWHKVPMTKNGSNYYVSNLPVKSKGNFYFIVNKNADIPYRNTVWETKNDVTVDCSTCAGNFSTIGPQERYVPKESDTNQKEPVFYYYISVKSDGSYSFAFDGKKTVTVTEGSIQPPDPPETVKITVPEVANATVKVTAGGQEYTSETFDVEVGSSFTVNVTPARGYELKSITYGNETSSKSPAQFTATTGGNIKVTVVPRDLKKYKVTFSSSDETIGTVSATNGTTPLATSPATVTEGDEVTFTAKPNNGYALSSWTVNGVSASSTANPYKITVDKDTTVVANFKVEDSGTIAENMHFLYGTSDKPNELQETQEYKVYEKDRKYIVTLKEKDY